MSVPRKTDVLIIGAGPAGSATAILLAEAGLRVLLVEQHEFPRQKVCGECVSAAALSVLDDLGIGETVRAHAGPELRRVGWMGSKTTIVAPFPRCMVGSHEFGRAIGRDTLDSLLMARGRDLGIQVLQPARVRRVSGTPGHFLCDVEMRSGPVTGLGRRHLDNHVWTAQVVVDAHGSWEQQITAEVGEPARKVDRAPGHNSDLFAFKATFTHSSLAPGLLPVIAFPGGYGGIVVAGDQRTTVACCIRRDSLRTSRARLPGQPAGLAVAATLQQSCPGVAQALSNAQQECAWLSVGPIRPGIRVDACMDLFRVGNAAGETHPLIGEGINMALHSARLVADQVSRLFHSTIDSSRLRAANHAYAVAWRAAFAPRLRYARWYAEMAMRPRIANPLNALLLASPSLMTRAARWAGKAHGAMAATNDGNP